MDKNLTYDMVTRQSDIYREVALYMDQLAVGPHCAMAFSAPRFARTPILVAPIAGDAMAIPRANIRRIVVTIFGNCFITQPPSRLIQFDGYASFISLCSEKMNVKFI